jgi:PleD family two-component response regulator
MARALVAEPSQPLANALALFLKRAGHSTTVAADAEAAVAQIHGDRPPELVIASTIGFPGEALCTRLKNTPARLPVLLAFGPTEENPQPRAQAAGADGYFLYPPRAHVVQPLAALALRVSQDGTGSPMPRGADAEFFKKYMTHEVKRSRRYRMPVALVLAGIDQIPEEKSPAQRAAMKAEAVSALSLVLRDIDIVVATRGDRFLIFLPSTGRDGAVKVASKVKQRLTRLSSAPGLKASVGVSFFEPRPGADKEVTFGKLLTLATAMLKTVQDQGGGKIGVAVRKAKA